MLFNVMEHVLIENNYSNDYICCILVDFDIVERKNVIKESIKILFMKYEIKEA